MKNIIVIAYQLNPFRGSECSVAWDYIVNMSKNHRLTVLFGSSEEFHMIGNTKSMMDYSNFDTKADNIGGSYDINGRNGVGGRTFLKNISIYNEENEYGVNSVDTTANVEDGQIIVK